MTARDRLGDTCPLVSLGLYSSGTRAVHYLDVTEGVLNVPSSDDTFFPCCVSRTDMPRRNSEQEMAWHSMT